MSMARKVWVALACCFSLDAFAVQLHVVADSYINELQPSNNFGSVGVLTVGPKSSSLLRFGMEVLPADLTSSDVEKVTLILWVNKLSVPAPADAAAFEVLSILEPWQENAVVQQAAPLLGASGVLGQTRVSAAGQFAYVDVTQEVKRWIDNPASNFGIALTSALNSGATVFFDSKENSATGREPRLELVLKTQGPVGPMGPVGAMGPRGFTGPSGAEGKEGPQGPKGEPGARGPEGLPGPAGPMGMTGPTGLTGPSGPVGPMGLQGFSGEKGEKGDKGDKGDRGFEGPPGATGPQGPAGPTGPVGPTGPRGFDGPQGSGGIALRQVFAGPFEGSWVVPRGVTRLKVTLVGPGGAGGVSDTVQFINGVSQPEQIESAGGGGGGGCYQQLIIDGVAEGQSLDVVVPSGGQPDTEPRNTQLFVPVLSSRLKDNVIESFTERLDIQAGGGYSGVSAKFRPEEGGRGQGGVCSVAASTHIRGAFTAQGDVGGRIGRIDSSNVPISAGFTGGAGATSFFGFGGSGGTYFAAGDFGRGHGSGGGGGSMKCVYGQSTVCTPFPPGAGAPGLIIIEY